MPIEERTGIAFYHRWQSDRTDDQTEVADRYCVPEDERSERWLSHTALRWGDYLDGGSDLAVANARDLPDVLGIEESSDHLYVERGDYGFRQHWVRIDTAPEDWGDPPDETGDERQDFANAEGHREEWEANVRHALRGLDDYPLFNDETMSNVNEEWAEAGWDDWGKADLHRTLSRIDSDFADWVQEEKYGDWPAIGELRQHMNYDPWHAEGGEGGMYFDIDKIAQYVVASRLAEYSKDEQSRPPGFDQEGVEAAADIMAETGRVLSDRRNSSWQFLELCMDEARRASWPKWDDKPPEAVEQFYRRPRTTNANTLAVLADAIEENGHPENPWLPIFRAYHALPDAVAEPVEA